jgi:hypothetical protein
LARTRAGTRQLALTTMRAVQIAEERREEEKRERRKKSAAV